MAEEEAPGAEVVALAGVVELEEEAVVQVAGVVELAEEAVVQVAEAEAAPRSPLPR